MVGVTPILFWESTYKELNWMHQAHIRHEELQWLRTRQVEYRIMIAAKNAMNGKSYFKVKQTSDLYKIDFFDKPKEPVKLLDPDEVNAILSGKQKANRFDMVNKNQPMKF